MLAAEILLGRWLFGYPWSRIAEDFDPGRGGLLGVVARVGVSVLVIGIFMLTLYRLLHMGG